METQATKTGKVILAAAGPGDPELVTIKTVRYLQQADLVLTDRLVSDEILKAYVSEKAQILYVGKQCRQGHSTPQATINELLVAAAREGKLVVRLKGGDVSIFSNILDELQTLAAHGIAYEIIPGVTAACGAAATAGIPLTARNYSTAVRFLTYYSSEIISDKYFKELATTTDTLVFYMSGDTLDPLVEQLMRHRPGTDKWIAVVEQATTPLQRVRSCPLQEYANQLRGQSFISPSLVIIGKVVALHRQFAWLPDHEGQDLYFKPVAKMAAGKLNPKEKRHAGRA